MIKTKQVTNYIFLLPVILLIVIKIPHLALPYFWDEAWSYFPAIEQMAKTGPSLIPGAIPLEFSKGHPQLFLFLSSLWMKFTPNSILAERLLPLLISVSLLLIIYFELKKIVNRQAGVIAITLLSVQSLFLAQATMLLPEMLVALLLILSLLAFYRGHYIKYALVSSLMVLTKETAIIYAFVIGIFYLGNLLKQDKRGDFKWRNLLFILTPGIVYSLFLLLHYLSFHVFFYATHLNDINLSGQLVWKKIGNGFNVIFTHYGRLLISIISIIVLILISIKRLKIAHKRLLWLIITCIFTFIVFSAINVFILRYLLGAMVLFITGFSVLIAEAIKNKYIQTALVLLISAVSLFFSLTNKKITDSDLGYVQVVNLQEEMVHYCESNKLYDEPISASFNLMYALENPDLGYRTTQINFENLKNWDQYQHAKYFIYDCTYDDPKNTLSDIKYNFKLLKSFRNEQAWGFIYENEHFEDQK